MKNILVGGAWPYANGSLHLGHIAGLLPGDVIARYHRAKGDNVYYVSGSDCHGTPVAIRAKQEDKTPLGVSNYYHEEFQECFTKLGFSYDLYTKTSLEAHKQFVKEFHIKLYESEYVYEKVSPHAYCNKCQAFMSDRFVIGRCTVCGSETRGDQCDTCGNVLEPENLLEATCAICGERIIFKDENHLYIAISKLENELRAFIEGHPNWRKNAIAFSNRYINEGLKDRALTRNLDWGIDVPQKGFADKKIYIWAENVLGYLSASKQVAIQRNQDYKKIWSDESKHYYVHGKDNIPFHTIILPSLLIANGEGWHLPDEIISSEYLTLEGKKISTSNNYAIWVKDIIDHYDADSIRYYLLRNGPEKKDSDFSWREYINSHNSELLGAYGNFINRTLVFISKYFINIVPNGRIDQEIDGKIDSLYAEVGLKIESGNLRDAINIIFEFIRYANRYFDSEQPWITKNTNASFCEDTLYNCVQMIANLVIVLSPFLPFSSEKVINWLNLQCKWEKQFVSWGYQLPKIQVLFERIDKKTAEDEVEKLLASVKGN